MLKKFIVLVGFSVLASCASVPLNYAPEARQISFPELNVETSATVGDTLVAQGVSSDLEGITLSEVNAIGVYEFSPGFYPQIGEDEEYTYHSYQMTNSGNGLGSLRVGGLFGGPAANDVQSLRASKVTQELCAVRSLGLKNCDTEHTYVRTQREAVGSTNFQQRLLYNGRAGDIIRIGYREFSGTMARPAFSNEVQYDLSQSNEIAYSGARIRVINADNQQIRYVLLRNFNTSNERTGSVTSPSVQTPAPTANEPPVSRPVFPGAIEPQGAVGADPDGK